MKMKKLLLLLTLGLTFPGAHLLAGGISRQENAEKIVTDAASNPENNNTVADDNGMDLFSLLSDEELLLVLSKLNVEDFYNAALTNKRFAGIIIKDLINKKFTPREIEVIKSYWVELDKIKRSSDDELERNDMSDVFWKEGTLRVHRFEQALMRIVHPAWNPRFKDLPKDLKMVILSKFARYAPKLKADIFIDIETGAFRIKYLTSHGETIHNC